VLGFGFIMNSGLIVIGAIVAYVVTRYAYIRREEEILVERYGEAYVNYKKIVTF
jgi:protein-S-isoprenylcysteine O-methyltransferase Ste14